jgi:hypothetical protein
VVWALAGTAYAHEAFPARLQIDETAPGVYDVAFTLPVIEGRKLRAEPRLPPTCQDTSPRETGATPGGVTTAWEVRCDPASLAGEVVLVDGLLGTQTDLAVRVTTLDGRVHSAILKPSRPGLVIPSPPRASALAMDAAVAGMRRALRNPALWVLLLVVACLRLRWRPLAIAVVACAGGHLAGQWLAGLGWLQVSAHAPPVFAALSAVVPALGFARRDDVPRGWLRPLWLVTLLLGLLLGGSRPEAVPPEGLSHAEQLLAAAGFTVGVALGLALIAIVAIELRKAAGRVLGDSTERVIGYLAGIVGVGMLVHRASVLLVLPDALPRDPLSLVLLAVLLGPTLRAMGAGATVAIGGFAALLSGGMVPGLSGVPLPLGTLLVLGTLFLFGAMLGLGRHLPPRWTLPVAALAAVAHAWYLAFVMADNVSRPVGATVGVALLAVAVLHASLEVRVGSRSVRLLGGVVAVLAVVWRLAEYGRWFDRQVATEAALGLVRLPLLSAALVVAAVVVWPRRRRLLRQLGVETRTPLAAGVLLALAFFVLPVGSPAVRNPFFEPHAPAGDQVRRVLASVLTSTYTAFNLGDEDELYDRLAENVSGDLVADVYLDSRRRLTAGTREGAKVTVKDVSVLDVGEVIGGGESAGRYSYPCKWVVTARVQHMQHVHHRQNTYHGLLTIRLDRNRWKIAWVELHGEERVVVPWRAG